MLTLLQAEVKSLKTNLQVRGSHDGFARARESEGAEFAAASSAMERAVVYVVLPFVKQSKQEVSHDARHVCKVLVTV